MNTVVFIVGASKFKDNHFADIPNIEVNVRRLKDCIKKVAIAHIPDDNIVIINGIFGATYVFERLKNVIDNQKNDIDLFIFYYAGHGRQTAEGVLETFLVTPESTYEAIRHNGINMMELRKEILRSSIKKKVVIIDSCHSGAVHGLMKAQTDSEDIFKEFREDLQGTFFISSSSQFQSSKYPPDKPNEPTYFTGCLVDVLEKGIGEVHYPRLNLTNISSEIKLKFKSEELYRQVKDLPMPIESSIENIAKFRIIKNLNYKPMIKNIDCIVLVDKSSSMMNKDVYQGDIRVSRWKKVQEWLKHLCSVLASLDEDGIDVMFFSDFASDLINVQDEDDVNELFNGNLLPIGGTNLFKPLEKCINIMLERKGDRHKLLVVITDGNPDAEQRERNDIENLIVNTARKIKDRRKLSILFIQIGTDPKCAEFLDLIANNLEKRYKVTDIVEAKTYEETIALIQDNGEIGFQILIEHAFSK